MKYLRNLNQYRIFRKFFNISKYNTNNLAQFVPLLNENYNPYLTNTFLESKTECNIDKKNYDLNNLSELIKDSTQLILDSLHKYGYSNVYLSFNGGKDSLVSFHLYRLASKKFNSLPDKALKLQAVYFKDPLIKEFPEIKNFINFISKKYDFDLRIIESSWNKGVKAFDNPNLAFILGTRSSDKGCENIKNLEFGKSDDVEFLRISPILNWTYGDVWNFLIFFQLDYCELYDMGYTSIGSIDDSFPNPYLKRGNTYLPAYQLAQWEYERCSRIQK